MNDSAFMQYCLSKPGAQQSLQNRWRTHQARIGGILFAMVENGEGRPAVAVKTSCEQAARLRSLHKDIVPSRRLNKAHWSTVFLDGAINDSLLYQLVDSSYQMALHQAGDAHLLQ
ncbi:MmcQ/YjbR family DNA-binding protein [Edwardsiella ictaluri]|nr:MmcQ/YjbR family DNA-binding protein [Edwardsiella ictaluri]AVZ82524.1 MmcQ/YjbR family DNA-binding protein [Edwardsiella ictaluri]EKS7761769.1 MmcQ/YjbR family DNA-binding protein [Edwardsiella ictaluri]EKS7770023.1 MmcQ/YjbR family DNA-binding protein [Edwardsiella ictaluri]EKS7773076.1 MmcQ/YjbR family DNA-binding protein [Edwardsiella ictaluri]EKS7775187.1 MmcQ/YjbR family DNA-binding protein [Edwardsiella ictaluri]